MWHNHGPWSVGRSHWEVLLEKLFMGTNRWHEPLPSFLPAPLSPSSLCHPSLLFYLSIYLSISPSTFFLLPRRSGHDMTLEVPVILLSWFLGIFLESELSWWEFWEILLYFWRELLLRLYPLGCFDKQLFSEKADIHWVSSCYQSGKFVLKLLISRVCGLWSS